MRQKNEIQAELLSDVPNVEPIKTVIIQDTIWENMREVRCFAQDGKVYAAFYMGEDKVTEFAEVPDKKEPK